MVFYVRSQADIYKTLDRYLREMRALGVIVENIQTDSSKSEGETYYSAS